MKQQTLTGLRSIRRRPAARFLAEMEREVRWGELCALIEPHFPKASPEGRRPPIPLEQMLCAYFLQQGFNLSDPAVEDALYDTEEMREFVGIDLGRQAVPRTRPRCASDG